MKTLSPLLCFVLACAAAAPAVSATRSASFEASLTIVESCRVDAGAGAPVVACQMASPVAVAQMIQAPATPAAPWLVTF